MLPIVLLALALVGCETVNMTTGSAPSRDLQLELKTYFPRVQWRFFDYNYEPISSSAFFNSFIPEYRSYLKMRGIHGVTSGFSEKQYAEVFKIQLGLWMQRTLRRNVQSACGILVTDPNHLKANDSLPSAWVLVNLQREWVVVHPVSLRAVRLSQFPHRGTITAVQF